MRLSVGLDNGKEGRREGVLTTVKISELWIFSFNSNIEAIVTLLKNNNEIMPHSPFSGLNSGFRPGETCRQKFTQQQDTASLSVLLELLYALPCPMNLTWFSKMIQEQDLYLCLRKDLLEQTKDLSGPTSCFHCGQWDASGRQGVGCESKSPLLLLFPVALTMSSHQKS